MHPADFKKLGCLVEYSDEVFKYFYEELLSNKVFSMYFTSEEQVKALLNKQKENFVDTLRETREDLLKRYYRVGIIHYEHYIPYEVFLSGTQILRDAFNATIIENIDDTEVALLNSELFDFISEAMAKGYMDKFISSEKADLDKILSMTKNATFGTEKRLLVHHYNWMMELLTAIEKKNYSALDELLKKQNDNTDSLYDYITEHLGDIDYPVQTDEIERIRFRIIANTENIFFYLKREAYSEVLSLIINILEIYKLTLVLDNMISNIIVRKAENVISEMIKLSETDPLTNVMNRRKFEELLENLLLRAQRVGLPLSIIVIDIDDFKLINDKHGHQTGDQVLVDLAYSLNSLTRDKDHLVRYGGEEFVIICADSGLDGAIHLAEKLRKGVECHDFSETGQVTISLGVAELREDDDSASLFKRADDKLYQAKSSGKNCVCH